MQHACKKSLQLFSSKNLGEYHDLYLKSGTLLSVDVFENFRKMRIQIYQLDLTKFRLAPGLAC